MATNTNCADNEDLGVELTKGLNIATLEQGTMFDIKVPLDHDTDFDAYPINYDNFPEEELLKYTKSELLAVSSDEELDDVDRSPFEKLRNEMEDISPDQDKSVLKQLKRPGLGASLPENALVTVQYNAYLDQSAEPFDSTYIRKKPHTFRLNTGEVILGLEISVQSMKVRELSEFLICPDYAFGEHGCLNRIPPNATVLFVVEVISCVDNSAMIEFNNLTYEEQSSASFKELMKVARAQHATGNDLEKKKFGDKALQVYLRATRLLENAHYSNETDEAEGLHVLLKLYTNISRLSFSFKKYRRCCKYGDEALQIDRKCIKALYWVGCACIQMCHWDRAKTKLLKARSVDPCNAEVVQALELLNRQKKEADDKEKNFCRRMFPGAAAVNVVPKKQIEDDFLETVVEVLSNFHLNGSTDPLVINWSSTEEADCIDSEAGKYDDLEIIKSEGSIKISKKA